MLLTFENEARFLAKEFGDAYQIVIPSLSIEAELPVALVDKVVDRKGTRKVAEAYVNHLWSEEGQRLAAEHYLRPRSQAVLRDNAKRFAPLKLLRVEDIAGSWANAQKTHFDEGGVFDQLIGAVGRFAN